LKYYWLQRLDLQCCPCMLFSKLCLQTFLQISLEWRFKFIIIQTIRRIWIFFIFTIVFQISRTKCRIPDVVGQFCRAQSKMILSTCKRNRIRIYLCKWSYVLWICAFLLLFAIKRYCRFWTLNCQFLRITAISETWTASSFIVSTANSFNFSTAISVILLTADSCLNYCQFI